MDSPPLLCTWGFRQSLLSIDRNSGCSEKRHQPNRGDREGAMGTDLALQGCPEQRKSGNETLNQLQVTRVKCMPLVSWLSGLTCSFANMLMRGQINLVELDFTSQRRYFHCVLWWRGIINKEPARSLNPAGKFSPSSLWGLDYVSGVTQTRSIHV